MDIKENEVIKKFDLLEDCKKDHEEKLGAEYMLLILQYILRYGQDHLADEDLEEKLINELVNFYSDGDFKTLKDYEEYKNYEKD